MAPTTPQKNLAREWLASHVPSGKRQVRIHCKYAANLLAKSGSTVNMQRSAPGLHRTSPFDDFLKFINRLYYFFWSFEGTRALPGNFSSLLFSPLFLFAPSPLRRDGRERGRPLICSGFAECLEEFACFCQDLTNVSAISLLPRRDFAAISQDSMNASANSPTFSFFE